MTTPTAITNFNTNALDKDGNPFVSAFRKYIDSQKDSRFLIVLDEAHHAPAYGCRNLLINIRNQAPRSYLLGLTATPTYSDENRRGWLSKIFDQWIIYEAKREELYLKNILARENYIQIQTNIEMPVDDQLYQRLVREHKDLPEPLIDKLARNSPRNDFIVNEYLTNREMYGKTIIFADRWFQCVYLKQKLQQAGIRVDAVYSHTDADPGSADARNRRTSSENKEILEQFKRNELDVLINVRMLTEGTDVPNTKTVFITRDTTSSILLTQMIGRALRGQKAGGGDDKKEANIVFFTDTWKRLINWATPAPGGGLSEETQVKGYYPLEMISIRLVEELSRQINSGIVFARQPFNAIIPMGWYEVSYVINNSEDGSEQHEPFTEYVLVYNHTHEKFRNYIEYAIDHAPDEWGKEELDEEWMQESIMTLSKDFFEFDQDDLGETLVDDIKKITRYIGQQKVPPRFLPFEEREKYDLDKLALKVLEIPPIKHREILDAHFSQSGTLWKTFYKTYDRFKTAVDGAVNRLLNAGDNGGTIEIPIQQPVNKRELNEDEKEQVKARDGYCCLCCGIQKARGIELVIDHILPVVHGGEATIDNAAYLDKYTQYYIGLPLEPWKLSRGNSLLSLDVKLIRDNFFVEADLWMRGVFSGTEHIESLKGHISTRGNVTGGTFAIDDPNLKGDIRFTYKNQEEELKVSFDQVQGLSQKALKILDIDLALQGRMTGDFLYISRGDIPFPQVKGNFQSPALTFYDFDLQQVQGKLDFAEAIHLKDLDLTYKSGKGEADVYINYNSQRFKVGGKVSGIDLQQLHEEFKGKTDVEFAGEGEFNKDPIILKYSTGNVNFYQDQSFIVSGAGKIYTDFSNFQLESEGQIKLEKSISPVILRLNQTDGQYSGNFHADIKNINLLIPWGYNQGEIAVDGQIISSESEGIGVEGHAAFMGKTLSFPNFPHVLEDFQGDLIFKDLQFNLRSLKGTMGNGPVEGQGYINIKNNKMDSFFFRATGRSNTLYLMDRTRVTLDADLTLNLVGGRLLLAGDIQVLSGLWERELEEGVFFNTDPSLSASGSTILEMLDYDMHIMGSDNIWFRNSFGEGTGQFNLRLTGNVDFPILLGYIQTNRGSIFFAGKKFDIIKGKITYNNKFQNDPLLDIEAEAFIKTYRLKFTIKGLSTKPDVTLQSSPPLPTQDIMSLIAVGELFKRSTSADLSNQVGRGTTGLIASELTDQIQKRTKKIFGDYLLRIDPNISNLTGTSFENTSRLIVGKEITRDFLVVYSTDFSTQRQQVVYLQYQLSPSISLIGMRNETGDYSLDLRFRKRN